MVTVDRPRRNRRAWAGALVFVPLLACTVAVAVQAYRAFDPVISGDYVAHLDYLRYIQARHSLPRADQGFEMYHPPVYYLTTVVVHAAIRLFARGFTLTDAGRTVATAAWVLEGGLAALIVARLGAGWLGRAAAAAIVWLLPGQVNVATRLYPETMAGLGVGLMLLGVVDLTRGRRNGYLWLGVGVPVAALSKYSGLVAVAIVVPVVVWSHRERLRPLVLALSPGSVAIGAFYLANVVRFGTPTPLNADLFHLEAQGGLYAHYPPGFFTRLSLGRCAAAHSFYGSAWKWLWATDCGVKPPWTDHVTGPLLVAAVATTVVGAAAWVWAARRHHCETEWRGLVLVPAGVLAAFVYYNARVPSGSSGLYLLVAAVPAAVVVGAFVDRPEQPWVRYLTFGMLAVWAGVMAHAGGVG